jgi:TM2 domain-containing membrane protein YozV
LSRSGTSAAIPSCIFGWLIPGGGHFFLGRWGRGLVFLVTVGALFMLGVAMDARLSVFLGFEDIFESLRTIAQFFFGIGTYLARALGYQAGDVQSVFYEYGNTFTEVAGLLNILVMLDAYDIAVGRKP